MSDFTEVGQRPSARGETPLPGGTFLCEVDRREETQSPDAVYNASDAEDRVQDRAVPEFGPSGPSVTQIHRRNESGTSSHKENATV